MATKTNKEICNKTISHLFDIDVCSCLLFCLFVFRTKKRLVWIYIRKMCVNKSKNVNGSNCKRCVHVNNKCNKCKRCPKRCMVSNTKQFELVLKIPLFFGILLFDWFFFWISVDPASNQMQITPNHNTNVNNNDAANGAIANR